MAATQKINFLTLVSYSLLQTLFRQDVQFRHNTKRYRRQTDDRQTRHCTKGSTDSTVGQKLLLPLKRLGPYFGFGLFGWLVDFVGRIT